MGQKVLPEGFGRVVRFYRLLSGDGSFRPDVLRLSVDEEVFGLVVRVLSRYLRVCRGVRLGLRMPSDGMTAFGIDQNRGRALVRWAERRVAGRRGELPYVVVQGSGELLSVEYGGGSVEDSPVDGFEVAAHRRGGVGMAEDSLDVEEVEQVSSVLCGRPMEAACCGSPEVVRSDVAQSCGFGSEGRETVDAHGWANGRPQATWPRPRPGFSLQTTGSVAPRDRPVADS